VTSYVQSRTICLSKLNLTLLHTRSLIISPSEPQTQSGQSFQNTPPASTTTSSAVSTDSPTSDAASFGKATQT
jgi:hypothetical protein